MVFQAYNSQFADRWIDSKGNSKYIRNHCRDRRFYLWEFLMRNFLDLDLEFPLVWRWVEKSILFQNLLLPNEFFIDLNFFLEFFYKIFCLFYDNFLIRNFFKNFFTFKLNPFRITNAFPSRPLLTLKEASPLEFSIETSWIIIGARI